jgi:exopolyphosphatase/guanosine-5'-triphosphate,3'-diphosphate pyrophosphatase
MRYPPFTHIVSIPFLRLPAAEHHGMSNAERSNRPIIAAFDIGSNTIKMTVGECSGNGRFRELASATETVRLSEGIERSGSLRRDRIDAALSAITRFAIDARAAGAGRLIGVGTEALRVAENGPAFLERVQRDIGIDCRVITGAEEAALTFRGLAAELDLSGSILIADIGGGSTELVAAKDGTLIDSRSVPLGSGRLTDRLVTHDPPTVTEIDACRTAARQRLDQDWQRAIEPDRLIAVGGTGEFLMRLVPHEPPASAKDINHVLHRLSTLPAAELARLITIPEARARVLPAGVAIVAAIADCTKPPIIEAARSGLRSGLLLDACAE